MKAVCDKLLFVLALLILIGSVVYFFVFAKGDPEAQSERHLLTKAPSGGAYESVPVPHFERQLVPWPAPKAQDAEGHWLFDVFTPPRIYWDPVSRQLVSEPWQPAEQAPPFGLQLVGIDQEEFRIQMEAYFTGATNDDTIIQFVDVEKDNSFRGTVGTTFEDHQVRVDNFEIKREFNPDGSITTVGTAVITDLRDNEQYTLIASQRIFIPGSFAISLRTSAPLPVENFQWKSVGDKKDVGDATFVLDAFDLDAKTVTVTKTAPKLAEPEQQVLSITSAAPAAPAAPLLVQPPASQPAQGNSFQDLFR